MGLGTAPTVQTYGEVFRENDRQIGNLKSFYQTFSSIFAKHVPGITHLGIKILYYQLSEGEWERFYRRQVFKIILLTRRNALRRYTSIKIAMNTRVWLERQSQQLDIDQRRITHDVDRLVEDLRKSQAIDRAFAARFKDWNPAHVVYEEMIADPAATFARLGTFLGTSGFDHTQIPLRRQNPEPLDQLISNFDAVAEALHGTEFEAMLYD